MSKLDQFITSNRDEFDSYEPGPGVWKNIEKDLPCGKPKRAVVSRMVWQWSAAAAVLLIVLGAAYYIAPSLQQRYNRQMSIAKGVPPEYAEEMYHFTRLIEIKHNELEKAKNRQPELYRRFSVDVNKLDSNYQALKKELPGNPNHEVLIQAMIQNLQLQIDLLNQQLTIIQKINQFKDKPHEHAYKST